MNKDLFRVILENHKACNNCASKKEIDLWYNQLLQFLFPDLADSKFKTYEDVETHSMQLKINLKSIFDSIDSQKSEYWVRSFSEALPKVYHQLKSDVKAHFFGDPAANSEKEVVIAYPGFWAVASYRIANEMYLMGIPVIPRLITENAHSKTGIDIHPGATIGSDFCIDHGTGIVIGETSIIGNHVKIYQGVTLGALSVDKKDADKKRHPTIEDGVVIYAGATILGGKTVIGKGSIIGGNVWITKSVKPNSKVYYKNALSDNDKGNLDLVTIITED